MKKSSLVGTTLLLALGVNIGLAKMNIDRRGSRGAGSPRIHVGDLVPEISARSLSGAVRDLAYGEGQPHRVYFFFSIDCPQSRAQAPEWKALMQGGFELEFVGLVSESEDPGQVDGFLRSVGMGTLHVLRLTDADRSSYGLRISPTTLLATPEGRVVHATFGRSSFESLGANARSISRPTSSLSRIAEFLLATAF